jgi:uncharacterized protein
MLLRRYPHRKVSSPAAYEGAGPNGHLNALGHDPQNYTVVHVGVDDIKSYIAKAEGLGARRLVGPISIPAGQFAWVSDPTGTVIGLWEAATT